jgi:hypothetical protein
MYVGTMPVQPVKLIHAAQDLCYDAFPHTVSESRPPQTGLSSSKHVKTNHHNEERLNYKGNVSFTTPDGMEQPIYQRSLSGCLINTEKSPSKTRRLPRLNSSPTSEVNSQKTRRKRAHSLIEKRSRENLNLKFLELEKALSHRRRGPSKCEDPTAKTNPQRMKRVAILDHARNDILELEAEVQSLSQKIQTMREIAFPDTCKFTLHVD